MNQLTQTFEGKSIRVVLDEQNNPLFVARDILNILEIKDTNTAMSQLDSDEHLTQLIAGSGQKRNMKVVTESGLYVLIFQSRKPEARKFRKWVTNEVLPSIRKTGSYGVSEYRIGSIKLEVIEQIIELKNVEERRSMFKVCSNMY